MTEEEKVGVALRAMPLNIDHSIIRGLRRSVDYETLKDNLDDEIEFVKDHQRGPVARAANIVNEEDRDEHEEEGEMDPALLSAMLEAAGEDEDMKFQVLAFAAGQGGRFKRTFKKFVRKGDRADKRPNTPPRQAPDASKKPNCINCG